MMSIDLPDPPPPPRPGNAMRPQGCTPCAGLFGWRKENDRSGAPDRKPAATRHDHPGG